MMKTAEKWFDIHSFDNGVTRIREQHLDPVCACNIWVIHGRDRHIVLDSGTGMMSLKQAFPQITRHPVTCIASHSHFDHCGGCFEFEDVRIHPAEADILTSPTRKNTTVQGFLTRDHFLYLPFDRFTPEDYQVRPALPKRVLSDGEGLDLGNRRLEVIHLPGHSPGLVGLYEPETQMLFSSDAIYDGPLFDDVYHSNIKDYKKSMHRLLSLKVSVVHGGHFESFGRDRMHTLIYNWLDTHKGE